MLFLVALGLLVLGPKHTHALLRQVAKYKADLDRATRSLQSQLTAELDAANAEPPLNKKSE
jgi:hypothetical protein